MGVMGNLFGVMLWLVWFVILVSGVNLCCFVIEVWVMISVVVLLEMDDVLVVVIVLFLVKVGLRWGILLGCVLCGCLFELIVVVV